MTDQIIDIKTGSSGLFTMIYSDPDAGEVGGDGEPINLTGYSIFMDFVDRITGKHIASLRYNPDTIPPDRGITIIDAAAGSYAVDPGQTDWWPLGNMPIDILYMKGGVKQHTETFQLNVLKGITRQN